MIEVVKVVATVVGSVCMALGLPTLLLYAIKERRQNKAVAEVAERTVNSEVIVKDTAADDARLLHALAAFDAERISLQRQRDDAYAEIDRQRSEITYRDRLLEHRDELIAELRQRAEDLLERLTEATREVHAVRVQLSELAAESQHEKTRPTKETSL